MKSDRNRKVSVLRSVSSCPNLWLLRADCSIQIGFTSLVLPFWYWLTQVVPDKIQEGHKMVVCVCVLWWDAGEVQICIWPSWCHCHSLTHVPVNADWFLPMWCHANVGICYDISIRLCVTCVLCVKMPKHFVTILLLPDSPIILVFRHQGSLLNSDGFTPTEGAIYRRGIKWGSYDQ